MSGTERSQILRSVLVADCQEARIKKLEDTPSPYGGPAHIEQTKAWLRKYPNPVCSNISTEDVGRLHRTLYSKLDGDWYGIDILAEWCRKGGSDCKLDFIVWLWSYALHVESFPHLFDSSTDAPGNNGSDTLAKVLPREVCDLEISAATEQPVKETKAALPLQKYSLELLEMESLAVAAIAILGQLVLLGQFTIFFAAPNTGKTLLMFYFLVEAIKQRRVDPSNVFYLDMDDNSSGLLEKLRIANELGFHIVADGYADFSVSLFIHEISEMTAHDQARGVILILDTYKKFANVMDKGQSSRFNRMLRRFVVKGGTVIALAHTNKNPGPDGRPVYGGTTDTLDDADCAYLMRSIAPKEGSSDKVVEFENIKRRGNVAQIAAYSYSTANGISYEELLASVQPVGESQLAPLKRAAAMKSDAEVIDAIEACVREGIISKMKLRDAVAERTGVSLRIAVQTIEKYTGDDPEVHRWKFSVHDRGAKVFVLLDCPQPAHRVG